MHKLESLDAWKATRRLSSAAYRLTMDPPLRQHFRLTDQIRRAAISIPANLAEGYGLSTRSQLVRCSRISLGSAYELKAHFELALDVRLVSEADFGRLKADCDATISLLIGLLRGLRAQLPR